MSDSLDALMNASLNPTGSSKKQPTDWTGLNFGTKDLGNLNANSVIGAGDNFGLDIPKDAATPDKGWNWFSSKDPKTGQVQAGALGEGIGAFTGIANAYLGWQQFNLAKDQMAQNKKIFNLNFSTQAQTLNTEMADRQRVRVARGSGAESVDSYMAKNSIKVRGI